MRQLASLLDRHFGSHKRLVRVTQKQQNVGNFGQSCDVGIGTSVLKQLGVGRQVVEADHFLQTGARR
jgi:hypothetical protein